MLQQFGFTKYESQVYQSLINTDSPLDASTIVKSSGVPRSKVYEVLQRLVEKGLVMESTVEKKRLYKALPIESTVQKLKADFDHNIDQLRKVQAKQTPMDDRVWSLKDDSSIQSVFRALIRTAEHSIHISGWADDLSTCLPLLEEKQKSGLEISVHSIGELTTVLPNVSILIPDHEHGKLERSRVLISDRQEMLFAAMENNEWQAIQTKSGPLVKFFTEFFYHDVALTEITRKYKDKIMEDSEIKDVLLNLRY
ncbi:TrmB family transcriptional regulator [Sediminibacillus massiliensis]|uniref:TrmB family transcriptional regulator n=1 Tax=Sediminibacillus massiliensis TaxID=1926277 RepID=UPI0009884476|nr:helix-turn-helix domain-containing protein [Sediminibacillus massiliensis]